jgi:hypothetical protein
LAYFVGGDNVFNEDNVLRYFSTESLHVIMSITVELPFTFVHTEGSSLGEEDGITNGDDESVFFLRIAAIGFPVGPGESVLDDPLDSFGGDLPLEVTREHSFFFITNLLLFYKPMVEGWMNMIPTAKAMSTTIHIISKVISGAIRTPFTALWTWGSLNAPPE